MNTTIGELDAYAGITDAEDLVRWAAPGVSLASHEGCVAAVIFRQIPQAMARNKFQMTYAEFIDCDSVDEFYFDDWSLTRAGKLRLEMVRQNALEDITLITVE